MEYNYSKLSGKIKEVFGGQRGFAEAMCLSENAISRKLQGKSPWKDKQMHRAVTLLGLEATNIPEYFFENKVEILQQIEKELQEDMKEAG